MYCTSTIKIYFTSRYLSWPNKPDSSANFLKYFINNIQFGIKINDKFFNFKIGHIVCDAPAISYLLNVRSFNAYFGCNTCIDEGAYINGYMNFLSMDSSY